MESDIRNAKILFIDDEPGTVDQFIAHLKEEGFSNIVQLSSVDALNQVVRVKAELVYLDIAGVASSISPHDEGVAVLRYIKKQAPWTRVVVLSGSTFTADRATDLSLADHCCTKASLSLADLVQLTEDELEQSLAPEFRNVRILRQIRERLDDANLGYFRHRKVLKALEAAFDHEGDRQFDWSKNTKTLNKSLALAKDLKPFLKMLATVVS